MIQVLDKALVAPGFRYAEECAGTNGIGSPLEDRRPFFVQGGEHFRENSLEFAWMGAPVAHPISGAVEGVLDVTCQVRRQQRADETTRAGGGPRDRVTHTCHALLNERILLNNFLRVSRKTSSAVVSLNQDFIISNTAASKLLDPSDQVLLWNWASCILTGATNAREIYGSLRTSWYRAKASKVGEGSSMAGVLVQMRVRQPGSAAARSRASIAARPLRLG